VASACACNPSYLGGRDQEDHSSKPASGKEFARPYLEKTQHQTRDDGMAHVVECLPSKQEALSSSPNSAKRRRRRKTKNK
jgi:hypothetical protein